MSMLKRKNSAIFCAAAVAVVAVMLLVVCSETNPTYKDGFVRDYFTLMTRADEGGYIVRVPEAEKYAAGTQVLVTAVPHRGWAFANWFGHENNGTSSTTVNMDSTIALFAYFERLEPLTLPVYYDTAGGTVSRNPMTTNYFEGDIVTLTAAPFTEAGYRFTGWDGPVADAGNATTTVSVTENMMPVIANFRQNNDTASTDTYTLTIFHNSEHGTVARDPEKIGYNPGERVTITATANAGYEFVEWAGDVDGAENPGAARDTILTIPMNSNRTISAVFNPIRYTLSSSTNPPGVAQVQRNPALQAYPLGEEVTVSFVNPNPGYVFIGWSGACEGTGACKITMTEDRAVTANFRDITTANPCHGMTSAQPGSACCTAQPTFNGCIPDDVYYCSYGPTSCYRIHTQDGMDYCRGTGDAVVIQCTGTDRPDDFTCCTGIVVDYSQKYTLTISNSPYGTGATTSPAGVQSGITAGTEVNISAIASIPFEGTGFIFSHWSISPSNSSSTIAAPKNAVTKVTVRDNAVVTANFIPNEIIDVRDNRKYSIVKIGEQIWMAQNLNFIRSSNEAANVNRGFCYENNDANCGTYGRLYDWATAMNLLDTCNTHFCADITHPHQGICPAGWHVPSSDEWTTLTNFVGSPAGTKLKSTSGWNDGSGYITGTDEFGFMALPGGFIASNNMTSRDVGTQGNWWTATQDNNNGAGSRSMFYDMNLVASENREIKTRLFSLRCVRND